MRRHEIPLLAILILPAMAIAVAFFLLPLARLAVLAGTGPDGLSMYWAILARPRYFEALVATVLLAATVTLTTLAISTVAGLFLERNRFFGRSVLLATLTFPLAFPGVVVGFLVIMLAGRQGLVSQFTELVFNDRVVFAYSITGLFMGYVYFSIPRVILTIMASAEKLDPSLEEAARSLGASQWRVVLDVILPALQPALIASGAIVFATAMGAFGTAFTLATNIDVLPMTIYTEFTLRANFAAAAALSIALGLITWVVLNAARSMAGTTVAAAG